MDVMNHKKCPLSCELLQATSVSASTLLIERVSVESSDVVHGSTSVSLWRTLHWSFGWLASGTGGWAPSGRCKHPGPVHACTHLLCLVSSQYTRKATFVN